MSEVYELSLSKNYVSSWTISDAIREILQNAIDSEKDGHEMYVNYNVENKELLIGNKYTCIDKSTLILGIGDKTNNNKMIGGNAEGYKLALVVLLRNNHNVVISNGEYLWEPYFEYSGTFNTELLKVKSTKCLDNNNLEFKINNISPLVFEDLKNDFPCIENDFGKVINTANGQILLDKKFKGKMFVEGLYVQSDDNFQFGYNFNACEVKLDRDRKAINYYDLKKLTAKAAITVEECNDEIYKQIVRSSTDTSKIADIIDFLDDDFAKEFTAKFYEENKLDDDVVVATSGVGKLLEKDGYKTFESNENVSAIVAKAMDKEDILDEAKDKKRKQSNESNAWSDFEDSNTRRILRLLYKIQNKLSKSEHDELYDIAIDVSDYSFRHIQDIVKDSLPECLEDKYINERLEEY